MSNLFKRGAVYWGRTQVAQRDYRRSLRTGHRPTAKRRLAAWVEEITAAVHFGEESHTWQEAVHRYVTEVMPGIVKESTGRRHLVSFRQVDAILRDKAVDRIGRVEILQVANRPGVTNATKRRDLTAVSAVLSACMAWGWSERNVAREFDRRIIRERRRTIILPTDEEIESPIAAAPPAMAAIIHVAWKTGLRLSEVVGLKHENLHMDEPAIYLPTSKTGVPRIVPLDDPVCREALGTILGTVRRLGCDFVFWHSDGEPYHNFSGNFGAARVRLNAHRKKAGLQPISFRFHDLRHRFAVDYLKATRSQTMRRGDVYRLAEILGHASVKTTEGYLKHVPPLGTKTGTVATVSSVSISEENGLTCVLIDR